MTETHTQEKKLKLTFCSGAGAVTGANFLLETQGANEGKKILIDCGMEQGTSEADETNWSDFPYNPAEIDVLFITHAHIDHIGRIPKIVSQGFKGRIISTDATRDLAGPMLEDTCAILSHYDNEDIKKMYTHETVARALEMWEGVSYHQEINLDHGFKCSFYDSGHILGSAMLHIEYGTKKILFTGDLGNSKCLWRP
jgi:metallo-beta-lactamase family protein